MISSFSGNYRFLSNFWPCEVRFDDEAYTSVEHAYVAAKVLDRQARQAVQACPTPGFAKRLGRTLTLRADWEAIKLGVMEDLLRQKFSKPALRELLLATDNDELVEGNTWGDTFWGVCDGVGQNHLGKLLMRIRDEARELRPLIAEPLADDFPQSRTYHGAR